MDDLDSLDKIKITLNQQSKNSQHFIDSLAGKFLAQLPESTSIDLLPPKRSASALSVETLSITLGKTVYKVQKTKRDLVCFQMTENTTWEKIDKQKWISNLVDELFNMAKSSATMKNFLEKVLLA